MATGDVLAARVMESAAKLPGALLEVDLNGLATGGFYDLWFGEEGDPDTAKINLTVTSPGYDETGTPTTIERQLVATKWVRKPTPDQADADESVSGGTLTVSLALSDYVYAGETVEASFAQAFYVQGSHNNAALFVAVTNNSTLAHPPVVMRWAWPTPKQKVQADFLLEVVPFHWSAMNGQPVAAVKFTVTDEHAHSVNVIVSEMTVSTIDGATDTGKVLGHAGLIPIASFTQADTLTCHFTVYPFVGDEDAVTTSENGISYPDERLCELPLLCDKAGTYGGGVAVVDAANGHASTAATWVTASQAAAELAYGASTAASYQTMGEAAQAISAYNAANLGRSDPGGGVILLTGDHSWPGVSPADQGAQKATLTITRLSSKTRAQCDINEGSNQSLGVRQVDVTDVALTGNSTGQITGTGTLDVITLDRCDVDLTGFAPFYQWRLLYASRLEVTALAGGFQAYGGSKWPWAMVRGVSYPQLTPGPGLGAEMYCVIGNLGVVPFPVWDLDGEPSDNGVCAFNQAYNLNHVAFATPHTFEITHGLAFVQNVFEKVTTVESVMEIAADGCAAPTSNVISIYNTIIGERFNNAYNEYGEVGFMHDRWTQKACIFDTWNSKGDEFDDGATGPNANRTGSWPISYGVGCDGNHRRMASGPGWLGDFLGLRSKSGGVLGYVNNAGYDNGGGGSALGNGDYHLDPADGGAGLALVGNAMLPFDLDGRPRALTNGDAGAYESQSAGGPLAYLGADHVDALYLGADQVTVA